eukprot:5068124-Pyramimonas_sp.AAC.1
MGFEATTHGWATHASLWVRVHRAASDLGYHLIKVTKVRGHSTSVGNKQADRLADPGADLHSQDTVLHDRVKRSGLLVRNL